MELKRGQRVWIGHLKRFGEIVQVSGRTCSVQVGLVRVDCLVSQVTPDPDGLGDRKSSKTGSKNRGQKARKRVVQRRDPPLKESTRKHLERLDLHGLRVEDAMREVDAALDRALRAGAERMEIIHGIGTGKLRHALHAKLRSYSVVAAFRIDEANSGVTWVYF